MKIKRIKKKEMKEKNKLNEIINYLIINIKRISEYKLLENNNVRKIWYNNKEMSYWIKDQIILILGLIENKMRIK